MKRKLTDLVIVILLLVLVALYIRAPLRPAHLGPVSVMVKGYEMNAAGQTNALVSISNEGSRAVDFAAGTQVLQTSGWVDPSSTVSNQFNLTMFLDPHIAPGSNRVVSIPVPPGASSWRVRVMCQKAYPEHWSKKLRWVSDIYIFKRGIVEHFYSGEMKR